MATLSTYQSNNSSKEEGTWSCGLCTFSNLSCTDVCQMCGQFERPARIPCDQCNQVVFFTDYENHQKQHANGSLNTAPSSTSTTDEVDPSFSQSLKPEEKEGFNPNTSSANVSGVSTSGGTIDASNINQEMKDDYKSNSNNNNNNNTNNNNNDSRIKIGNEGVCYFLIGSPGTGKSSLINLLCDDQSKKAHVEYGNTGRVEENIYYHKNGKDILINTIGVGEPNGRSDKHIMLDTLKFLQKNKIKNVVIIWTVKPQRRMTASVENQAKYIDSLDSGNIWASTMIVVKQASPMSLGEVSQGVLEAAQKFNVLDIEIAIISYTCYEWLQGDKKDKYSKYMSKLNTKDRQNVLGLYLENEVEELVSNTIENLTKRYCQVIFDDSNCVQCDDIGYKHSMPGACHHQNAQVKSGTHAIIEWTSINININTNGGIKQEQEARYKRSKNVVISKGDEHSTKSGVQESKVNYEYIQEKDAAKLVGGAAATSALTFYAVDLAIEQTFMSTIGAELAYAAGIGAWGGIVGVGLAAAGVLGVGAWTYHKNQQEKEKFQLKKEFNRKVARYNSRLEDFLKICKELEKYKAELIQQEKELLKKSDRLCMWSFERMDLLNKSILLIGPTGFGKSTIGNRLMGSAEDIYSLSERDSSQILFKIGNYGSKASETDRLKKVTKRVTMTKILKNNNKFTNIERTLFNLSVIDTPGAFDSKNRGIHQTNEMLEFYSSIGGVNMFCIVVRFNSKIDENYQKLLHMYEEFWGKQFWKHCCIIISYCDKDSVKNKKIMEKKLPSVREEVSKEIRTISRGLCKNVQIFEFGEENFEESLENMFNLLNLNNGRFKDKYVCDHIKSPIDKAWYALKEQFEIYEKTGKEIQELKNELDQMKRDLDK